MRLTEWRNFTKLKNLLIQRINRLFLKAENIQRIAEFIDPHYNLRQFKISMITGRLIKIECKQENMKYFELQRKFSAFKQEIE